MPHPNPMLHVNVSEQCVAHYTLWDGEVQVTVTQHQGQHGFYSAAMLVEREDSPLMCSMYEGYDQTLDAVSGRLAMRTWIADKLTILATGRHNAVGTYSEIRKV